MMKKIIFLFVIALSAFCVAAQDKAVETDKSKVEQVMLKKGSLILKEFINVGENPPCFSWGYFKDFFKNAKTKMSEMGVRF